MVGWLVFVLFCFVFVVVCFVCFLVFLLDFVLFGREVAREEEGFDGGMEMGGDRDT